MDVVIALDEIRTAQGIWINVQEPVREAFCQLFALCRHQQEQIESIRVQMDEGNAKTQQIIQQTRTQTTSELLKAIGDTTSAVRRDLGGQVQSSRADVEALMTSRHRELQTDYTTKFSQQTETHSSKFRSLEALVEAKLGAFQESFDVRLKSTTDFAETRVAGLQTVMDSRTSALVQKVDAKLAGVEEALIAKMTEEARGVADRMVAEARHEIVHDWQSLNIREHKEEVRRELMRQVNTLRQEQERRLRDLKQNMQQTLDEVTKRALGGTVAGQSKSAIADIVFKIREVESHSTQEMEKMRHEFCKALRDKLDASMVDEYTARVASLFERMGNTLNADSIGQLHTHAARVNQELRSHDRRMELQIADLESTRKELHEALTILREHQARIEESTHRALDSAADNKATTLRLAGQIDSIASELYGASSDAAEQCTCGQNEDDAAPSSPHRHTTHSFISTLRTQPTSPSRNNNTTTAAAVDHSVPGPTAVFSQEPKGLMGRLGALAAQVAGCATWGELRDVSRTVCEVKEDTAAAVKELLMEVSRAREDQEIACRALKMDLNARLMDGLASKTPVEAFRSLEGRLITFEGDASGRIQAARELLSTTASRVTELEKASEAKQEALRTRINELERTGEAEASARRQFEAHVDAALTEHRRALSVRVDDAASEAVEQGAKLVEEAVKGLTEKWQTTRTRDANSARDDLDALRHLVEQRIATSRAEAEAAVTDSASRVKAEMEGRIRMIESQTGAVLAQLAADLHHTTTHEELRKQTELILEVVAKRGAEGSMDGGVMVHGPTIEAIKKDHLYKLEDRVCAVELKVDRFSGRIEAVEKAAGASPSAEDVHTAIRSCLESLAMGRTSN